MLCWAAILICLVPPVYSITYTFHSHDELILSSIYGASHTFAHHNVHIIEMMKPAGLCVAAESALTAV